MSVSLSVCPFLCPAAALQQHRGHRTFRPCCRRTDTLLALFLYTKLLRLPHISVGLSVVKKSKGGQEKNVLHSRSPGGLGLFCHSVTLLTLKFPQTTTRRVILRSGLVGLCHVTAAQSFRLIANGVTPEITRLVGYLVYHEEFDPLTLHSIRALAHGISVSDGFIVTVGFFLVESDMPC